MGDTANLNDITGEWVFGTENKRNPHPLYHRIRAEAPIWKFDDFDDYLLTRWEDCEAVLRDPRWSSDPSHAPMPEDDFRAAFEGAGVRTLLFMDPPDHTRVRRLVSKAFTPRRVEKLREHVGEICDSLLADLKGDEPFEVMSGLAYPLPVIVICELLGVPVEDRHQMEGWSSDASRLLDFSMIDEETAMKGMVAAMQFINYFNGLFEARRAEPQDDLLTELIKAEEEGDKLSEEELRSIVLLLFVAGHETTMNLIGNGLFAMLQHRDQWERLVADPSLVPSAVEECLRFDGPVHLTGRFATTDLEVGGMAFRKGQAVMTLLAAANRDPEKFPDPDRFDVGRADNQHLTFSHGIHYCLGAALARMEGQVVFDRLARNFPTLQLACDADDVEYREHFILRGLKALPVTV
ncbi:MAG TPA: cytochrome P450 [Acidimicrobiales bacterium]|nr:cytochrome P450 [Acidimicrobiales bacterium]